MNLTSIFKKVVCSGVGKNNSKNRNKTFLIKNASFQKSGCHSNINVGVHVRMTLKCSQINFAKFGGLARTVLLNVIQIIRAGGRSE